jgi:hypothetical protein
MQLRDEFAKIVRNFETQGKAGSYIDRFRKTLNSFLAYHGIESKLSGIKIRDIQATPTLINERAPTQDELKRIFTSASRKTRIICALMAFSGVRPEIISNYSHTDGLTVGDLPEMNIKDRTITFSKIPTLIIVRRMLNKARRQYFTFMGEEGCFYLKAWMRSAWARVRP